MVETYSGKTTAEYLAWYKDSPQEILIETVGPCNLRCIGCPQSIKEYREKKSKPPFMDFLLFESILKQVKSLWRPVNVGLYHTGEITLLPHDKFELYLNKAKEILNDDDGWNSVGFYTNGLLLDAERRKSILNNKINWVRLSFDGGDKESYESVRIGSDFETVYENGKALARECSEADYKMRLEVIFVPYTENELKIGEYHKLWDFTGWKHYTGGTMNYGGLMDDAVKIRKHRYQGVRRTRHSVPCPRVFEQFSVLVDGSVSTCSADPSGIHVLGNLNRQSLFDVWNSSARAELQRIHIDKEVSELAPCNVCDYTDYCSVPAGEFFGEINES
jgi:radical SAM protein with 4Fe4S-binding SPASM domain